jgi:hypothetical protein
MNQPLGGPKQRSGYDVWLWTPGGVPAPGSTSATGPIRIGDAERDDAVATLGDHFAAGRLSRDELDERVDQAMQARFERELEPLFVDLPAPARSGVAEPTQAHRSDVRPAWPPLFWLTPLLVVATVVGAVALRSPWMLWVFVWMMMSSRFWGRRRYGAASRQHGQSPPTG